MTHPDDQPSPEQIAQAKRTLLLIVGLLLGGAVLIGIGRLGDVMTSLSQPPAVRGSR